MGERDLLERQRTERPARSRERLERRDPLVGRHLAGSQSHGLQQREVAVELRHGRIGGEGTQLLRCGRLAFARGRLRGGKERQHRLGRTATPERLDRGGLRRGIGSIERGDDRVAPRLGRRARLSFLPFVPGRAADEDENEDNPDPAPPPERGIQPVAPNFLGDFVDETVAVGHCARLLFRALYMLGAGVAKPRFGQIRPGLVAEGGKV